MATNIVGSDDKAVQITQLVVIGAAVGMAQDAILQRILKAPIEKGVIALIKMSFKSLFSSRNF